MRDHAIGVAPLLLGALYALLLLWLTGCGAAQVTAETARVAACEEQEAHIEARVDAHDLTLEQGNAQIDCTRLVCDAIHARLVPDEAQ